MYGSLKPETFPLLYTGPNIGENEIPIARDDYRSVPIYGPHIRNAVQR